jgi:gliding motility-associated-like protein
MVQSLANAPANAELIVKINGTDKDFINKGADSAARIVLHNKNIIANDIPVCYNTRATLKVSSADNTSNEALWYSDPNYLNLIYSGSTVETNTELLNDTMFYVELVSDYGCVDRDSLKAFMVARPEVIAMNDTMICYGDMIDLNLLHSSGTIKWNTESSTVSPIVNTDYVVSAQNPPCPNVYDTVSISVGERAYIQPSVLPAYRINVPYSQQLHTNAQSPIFSLINGNLPQGFTLNSAGNIYGTGKKNHIESLFTVRVEDANGCAFDYDISMAQEFFIPQVFTPNGDGINDIFMEGYTVIIFDRLGIKIFEGDNGWDGTYKGKQAPVDIYYYKIIDKNNTAVNKKTYSGYIGVERR